MSGIAEFLQAIDGGKKLKMLIVNTGQEEIETLLFSDQVASTQKPLWLNMLPQSQKTHTPFHPPPLPLSSLSRPKRLEWVKIQVFILPYSQKFFLSNSRISTSLQKRLLLMLLLFVCALFVSLFCCYFVVVVACFFVFPPNTLQTRSARVWLQWMRLIFVWWILFLPDRTFVTDRVFSINHWPYQSHIPAVILHHRVVQVSTIF